MQDIENPNPVLMNTNEYRMCPQATVVVRVTYNDHQMSVVAATISASKATVCTATRYIPA
jgi:hypothetical protein